MTDLHRELEQRARIWGRVLANEWQAELRRTSPVDTGNMRSKTTARDQPGLNSTQVTALIRHGLCGNGQYGNETA